MTTESCSLWRIKNQYKKDAEEDSSEKSKAFWEKLEKDKEEHIADLKELIKKELK